MGDDYEKARAMIALFTLEPSRFGEFQAEYCCQEPDWIIEGRHPPALEAALARLEPGQIAGAPLEQGNAYLIPRLVERQVLTAPAPSALDLPAPE